MKRRQNSTRTGLLAMIAAFLLVLPQVHAVKEPRHEVVEMPYGVALYHYFQEKYFSSIIDLIAAKQRQSLIDDSKSAELFLGGLYLSYGMQQQAHEIFEGITRNESGRVPGDVLAKAWFHIGKSHYMHADFDISKQALQSIGPSKLAPEYEAERLYMLAEVYMRDQQYDEAIRLLEMAPRESIWTEYTRFNLGIRLVENEQLYEGASLLEKLAASASEDEESIVLRDRSRLALAATHASLDRPGHAMQYLENISLGSPLADVALLGLGWLQYQSADFDEALQLWTELAERPLLNANVLEARLLLPRALEKKGEVDLALAGYENAVQDYEEQIDTIDAAVTAVRAGNLSEVLETIRVKEGSIDPSRLVETIGPLLGGGMAGLLLSDEFMRAVGRYRELAVLSGNLARWKRSIPSLDMILAEKKDAYSNSLADVVNSPKFSRAKEFAERRNDLVAQFDEPLATESRALLATGKELELMALLEKVSNGIDSIGDDHVESDALRQRYRLLAGLLQWHIDTDFVPRVWAIRKDIRELDRALMDTDHAVSSLKSVWVQAPIRHQRYRTLIAGKKERIEELEKEVELAMSEQAGRIRVEAEAILMQYRDRVEKYHERALFLRALAYDALVLNW